MPSIISATELRAVLGVSSALYSDSYLNGGNVVATLTLTYAIQPPIANDANLTGVAVSYP